MEGHNTSTFYVVMMMIVIIVQLEIVFESLPRSLSSPRRHLRTTIVIIIFYVTCRTTITISHPHRYQCQCSLAWDIFVLTDQHHHNDHRNYQHYKTKLESIQCRYRSNSRKCWLTRNRHVKSVACDVDILWHLF